MQAQNFEKLDPAGASRRGIEVWRPIKGYPNYSVANIWTTPSK